LSRLFAVVKGTRLVGGSFTFNTTEGLDVRTQLGARELGPRERLEQASNMAPGPKFAQSDWVGVCNL
jgi:hypothetical protein